MYEILKVFSLNKDGQLSECICPKTLRGQKCNCIDHQREGESVEDFCKRVAHKAEIKEDDIIEIKTPGAILGGMVSVFINDKDPVLRKTLAKDKILLNHFVNDPDPYVRAAVASNGYALEILESDQHPYVRQTVRDFKNGNVY